MTRTTREVLDDHLRLRAEKKLEEDIARNYSDDCVLLTSDGVFRGHDGVRQSADELKSYAPAAHYRYRVIHTAGEIGYLVWSADGKDSAIRDGADSYHIKDGKIVVQTIYYRAVET